MDTVSHVRVHMVVLFCMCVHVCVCMCLCVLARVCVAIHVSSRERQREQGRINRLLSLPPPFMRVPLPSLQAWSPQGEDGSNGPLLGSYTDSI